MHHHHEGHPTIRRHVAEELLQHHYAARRCPEADYRHRLIRVAPLLRAIVGVIDLLIRRDGIDGARLIGDLRDIAFSLGSACASG